MREAEGAVGDHETWTAATTAEAEAARGEQAKKSVKEFRWAKGKITFLRLSSVSVSCASSRAARPEGSSTDPEFGVKRNSKVDVGPFCCCSNHRLP